jgi:3-oxoacyl-[acyl-carrier-protein] synthase-3
MPTRTRTLRRATITGLGLYAPERVLTNRELETIVDTTDQWIVERTGIRERRIASPDQATSDLAVPAALEALRVANLSPSDLDLIIVATCTGDMGSFPATAAIVQECLGAKKAAAFDVAAVCSGFVYALDVAAQYVETGRYSRILVIGAEVMSRILDWTDRNTCVLFGDGAGAVIVQAAEGAEAESSDEGILGSILGTDGSGVCLLNVPAGGTRNPLTPALIEQHQQYMTMDGKAVYRFAIEIMGESALQALESVGLTAGEVDLFIPHQANIRIITAAARRLDLSMDKVFVNVDRYGNTSAASVPLAMVEAWKAGRIKPGSIIVTVGFGAGLTWGANVIRWGNVTP